MALEEMAIPYKVNLINLNKAEQQSPDFLKICPNGRIPAIVDNKTAISVFESGAILMYRAGKSDELLPMDLAGRYDVMQWLCSKCRASAQCKVKPSRSSVTSRSSPPDDQALLQRNPSPLRSPRQTTRRPRIPRRRVQHC
jgi:glutathione S-transferase